MQAQNIKADFGHLKKVVGSYGTIPTVESFLEGAGVNYRKTGKCQFLVFVGPLGVGKTTHARLVLNRLERQNIPARVGLVTFEIAQKIAARLKAGELNRDLVLVPTLERLDPSHTSGYYTTDDYRGGSLVFGLILYIAGLENDFVVVEAPGLGTKDRGMTALRDLVQKLGQFERTGYGVWVVALTAEASLYRQNLAARLRKVPLKPGKAPGGTGLGTLVGYDELCQALANHSRSRTSPNLYRRDKAITLAILGKEFYPWLLGEYYKIPERYCLVACNTQSAHVKRGPLPQADDYWYDRLLCHLNLPSAKRI